MTNSCYNALDLHVERGRVVPHAYTVPATIDDPAALTEIAALIAPRVNA